MEMKSKKLQNEAVYDQKINEAKKSYFFSVYIKMLEITRKNCYKSDFEIIIDNNSQYFWINLRDFEVETENK